MPKVDIESLPILQNVSLAPPHPLYHEILIDPKWLKPRLYKFEHVTVSQQYIHQCSARNLYDLLGIFIN